MSFLIITFLAWRITALVCYDKIMGWLRAEAGVYRVDEYGQPLTGVGRVLSCFWCTSLLVGPVCSAFWIGEYGWKTPLVGLAASGLAIILNHWSRIERDYGNL